MAKIILGKRPESIPRTLDFLQVDGSPGSMSVQFIYRTRKEFAAWTDGIVEAQRATAQAEIDKLAAAAQKGETVPPITQADVIAREADANINYVMGCLKSWDLDVPLDRAAVAQLDDEVPAAIREICATYRDAIVEGRQGN